MKKKKAKSKTAAKKTAKKSEPELETKELNPAQVLKDISVYSGNTILGDGNVIMINGQMRNMFGMPARDPTLHHGPVTLPDDPTGIAEPHDVLAAEEFAMPAPRPGSACGREAGFSG